MNGHVRDQKGQNSEDRPDASDAARTLLSPVFLRSRSVEGGRREEERKLGGISQGHRIYLERFHTKKRSGTI